MWLCGSLNILWHYLSLELKLKLTFFSPVDTAEFSKIAGIFSTALIITVNLLLKIVQTYYIQLVSSWLKFGSCLYSIGCVSIKQIISIQTLKKKKPPESWMFFSFITFAKTILGVAQKSFHSGPRRNFPYWHQITGNLSSWVIWKNDRPILVLNRLLSLSQQLL